MAEYGMSPRYAMWTMPVVAAYALLPAARYRAGGEVHGSPGDHAAAAARAKAKEFLQTHYRITS
jgi:hypothetical protein